MSSWSIQEEIETSAKPEKIWELWTDVKNWSQWDNEIDWSQIDGPFEKGTTGNLKPKRGPKTSFHISEVEFQKSFTDETKIMGTTIRFTHRIKPSGDRWMVLHQIEMKGMMVPLLRKTLGNALEEALPKALANLVKMAEE